MSPAINPFTLPEDQKGWRGLATFGRPRRRVYTVFQNEHVLVTALLQIPGEPGVRHCHETGELSLRWAGDMTPLITWHGPGEWHGGIAEARADNLDKVADEVARVKQLAGKDLGELLPALESLQEEVRQLREAVKSSHGPQPAPGLLIDVIFPPFKTVIEDPSYPERREIVGQWYD